MFMNQNFNFKCLNLSLVVKYDGKEYTLGCVEGTNFSMGREGAPEPYYGSVTKRHSIGTKKGSLTISRWYYVDEGQESLLLDMFNDKTVFDLTGSLIEEDGTPIDNTSITFKDCVIYNWNPKTGGADDTLGEEAEVHFLDWDISEFLSTNDSP